MLMLVFCHCAGRSMYLCWIFQYLISLCKDLNLISGIIFSYQKQILLPLTHIEFHKPWNIYAAKAVRILKISTIVVFCDFLHCHCYCELAVRYAPFFPRPVFLLCLYREPLPKKRRGPHTAGPKPNQLKTPTPKTQSKTPTLQPKTPNHYKLAKNKKKIIKNNPGKKYIVR